jgi:hypothetical protein
MIIFPTQTLYWFYLVAVISAGSKAKLYFRVWETGNLFAFRIVMHEFKDFDPRLGAQVGI